MGYQPSAPIDFDFLMAVPCDGIDRQSPHCLWCFLQIETALHSIGVVTIQQLLDDDLGLLFAVMEALLTDNAVLIFKNVVHIIRGGPLLGLRDLKELSFVYRAQEGYNCDRALYVVILRALHLIDIVCVSSLVQLDKYYILYRLDTHDSVHLPPIARRVLSAIIDRAKESEG